MDRMETEEEEAKCVLSHIIRDSINTTGNRKWQVISILKSGADPLLF